MTEKNDPWGGDDPNSPKEKPTPEKLAQIVEIHEAPLLEKPKGIPGWMWVVQGFSLVYVFVNIVLVAFVEMTPTLRGETRMQAIIIMLFYMVPLTMLLLILFYTVMELKKTSRGEKI